MGFKDLITPTDHRVEFECSDCGHSFKKELRPGENATCPECDSFNVEQV